MVGTIMKQSHLNALSTDELWALHLEVTAMLAEKIILQKSVLDDRLRRLNQRIAKPVIAKPARRPYPAVLPKYQNHGNQSETWSGRGRQPRWLIAQLKSGKHIDDFRIDAGRGVSEEMGHLELRLASVR
jgi:DNA-binding protein H-NS